MESKIIDRFEQGQSVDEIAAAMPAVPQDHIFDIVTLGYVDPNMVYTPPRPNQTPKPPMETAKKVDDFVEDDQLKSKWDSLDQSEKQVVKDVLAKKPNALDRFEETNMPMDIIIWAAQNGISGNMGNARGEISGRITQPTEGWDSFNSRREMRNAPTYRGKPWKDVKENLGGMPWPFKGQASQFDKKGPPGFSYFRGESGGSLKEGQWVDCLLWRDEKGILKGIVYHYPQNMALEKKGNVNIFISPDSKRKGIASTLLAEAIKRYNVDLRQQRYSAEGAAFVNNFVRRLPENSGQDIAGNMTGPRFAERDAKIIEKYKEGASLSEIAKSAGVTVKAVTWVLNQARKRGEVGKPRSGIKKPENIPRNKKIVELYESGKGYTEIARELGLAPGVVYNAVLKSGKMKAIDKVKKRDDVFKRNENIVDKFKKGITVAEIAKSVGVEKTTIRRVLSEARNNGLLDDYVAPKTAAEKYAEIVMQWNSGASRKEIAESIGTTPGTVASVLNRARKRGLRVLGARARDEKKSQ